MEDLLNLNASRTQIHERARKFDELAIGEYLVKSFKLKETTFGLRLHVLFEDFFIILPERYADKINSEEQITELNNLKWKMVYNGKNKQQGNRLMLDFEKLGNSDKKPGAAVNTSHAEDSTSEEEEREPEVKKRKHQKSGVKVSNKK